MNDRLVALIDMDCFYCQVEARLNPTLKGKPMAVVQYNQWKGGGIIAVNYEARDKGVTRHMRGEEAKKHCPEIQLVSVPSVRGKADLTKYRDAGREVIKVICEFSECVQRASVDEAFIDLTEAVEKRLANKVKVSLSQLENTFVVGYSPEDNNEDERERGLTTWLQEVYSSELCDPSLHRLATSAALVEEMRAAVFDRTGFRCSAGISHNKILAKLVCGLHKPNRQTVLPMSSVAELYRTLPVKKVRNLGGKFGNDVVETLGITHMGELTNFTEKQLQNKYDEKTGTWLYNIARGIDLDPVTPRLISKSIGCCKNFPGKTALNSKKKVTHWLMELVEEMAERLQEDIQLNKRKAQLLTIHFSQEIDGKDVSMSRSTALPSYEADKIVSCAFNILTRYNSSQSDDVWQPPLKYLGLSVGKFMEYSGNSKSSIDKFFKNITSTTVIKGGNINTCNLGSVATDKNTANQTTSRPIINNVNNRQTEASDPAPSCSNTSVKINGQVSFFEKYFKNRSNKIINNSPVKQSRNQEMETHDSLRHKHQENNQSDLTHMEKEVNSDDTENIKNEDSNDYPSRDHLIAPEKSEEVPENNRDDTWISPSEIFPDLENIDDSVMEILPSPIQRKITNMKTLKNSCPKLDSKAQFKQFLSNDSRLSTDSECAPTRVETVADIHASPGGQNIASSSAKCVEHQNKVERVDEDLIEPEGLFNTTSLDLFELEAEEVREEAEVQSEVCDLCSYCKESIPVHELPEHLDHHMAMELHEQLNKPQHPQRTAESNEIRPSKTVTVISDKKKRGRPSKKDNLPPKKSRTIVSFFTRS
ncbi:DNA polymerase eta [Homalodisca vitripennis]|nr:DNA polymerase eta [Homalodisca vitripennis]